MVSLADDLKAAASDALKKAASLLGVGLELYGAQAAKPAAKANGDPANRITARQLAALHAVCRRMALSRDDLLGIVSERFGAQKLEMLTKPQASELLDHFAGQP